MRSKVPKTIVVTGVNGFVGKHLARELKNSGHVVIGLGTAQEVNPEILNVVDKYYCVDLSEAWPELDFNVDTIIHLAGLAIVGESFQKPQEYININSAIMTRMCEYYLQTKQRPRILVVSSGAVYDPAKPMPLREESSMIYNSPYTISKALVEHQASYYRQRNLDCVVVRPFNHIGPGQTAGFLIPDVIKQLKDGDHIVVGNISSKRDYTDVRDIARAYRLLSEAGSLQYATYNACSGKSRSGKEMIQLIKDLMNKPSAVIEIDPSKVRPTDSPDIYGDISRLQEDTHWRPEISLKQTLQDCIADQQSK